MNTMANGIKVEYDFEGSGQVLVLIHALGLDRQMWSPQISDLSRRFRVLRYDLRGHGQTDKPLGPYSLELFVADLEALLRAIGIGQAHVLGISLGAMIAQLFAITYPRLVRRLVLAGAAATYDPDARRLLEERAKLVEAGGMATVLDFLIQRWFTAPFIQRETTTVDRVRQTLMANDPQAYAAACRAVSHLNLVDSLTAVVAPTLIVVGERDASTPPEMAETVHDHVSGSVLKVIKDASHLSNIEQPTEFNRTVLSFLGNARRTTLQAT